MKNSGNARERNSEKEKQLNEKQLKEESNQKDHSTDERSFCKNDSKKDEVDSIIISINGITE